MVYGKLQMGNLKYFFKTAFLLSLFHKGQISEI